MIIKNIKKFVWPLFFFLLISFIFNFSLCVELFSKKITLGDNILTELIVENSYQNILHLKNPLIVNSILYPFSINVSLNDPTTSYSLFFMILRPFLNPHRSLIIITLLGFFLNNFFMYLLLKKFKISQYLSIIVSFIFGFTPFLSHRILSHYTYIPIYFFPLVFLLIDKLFEVEKIKEKLLISLLLGLSMALILLSNFYYFLMIILGIIFFVGCWLFSDRKIMFEIFKKNISYFFISVISLILFLIPWILSVYELIKSGALTKTLGFGGAITLSADVLSFFTPSEYNPIYKKIFSFFSLRIPYFTKYNDFFLNSSEKFVYPGIIVIVSYIVLIYSKLFTKKFPKELWNKIKIYFYSSIFFATLMLGPFLKIFNRWSVNLDGVAVVFPLPFLLLHYAPGLSTLRAPSRFAPIFVFFACIVTAYILDYLIKKIGNKKSLILLTALFIIFFLDQLYVIPTKLNQEIPMKIYNNLKDESQGTVLEIPFTVRDGFQYIGFVHAIQPMAGQLIHGKPIIGGYMARVPENIFDYYKNLKFIGYLAKIIDKGNYMPLSEKPGEINLFPYPYALNTIKNEVKSLNIKYVILKRDEKYSNYILSLLKQVEFKEKQKDNNYLLLEQ